MFYADFVISTSPHTLCKRDFWHLFVMEFVDPKQMWLQNRNNFRNFFSKWAIFYFGLCFIAVSISIDHILTN